MTRGRWRLRLPGRRRGKSWDQHVSDVERVAASDGFRRLRDEIIDLAELRDTSDLLDVGAGTGLLTLAAAPLVGHVWALDISPAMCDHLRAQLVRKGIDNVDVLVHDATSLPFCDASFDVVVSNYCMHHLKDADKRLAVAEIRRVLRSGGRAVIGDMMFRITITEPRSRAVITRFAGSMLRRGPAGVLRLLTNAARMISHQREHPASAEWWRGELALGGFEQVNVRELEHEGGIAVARVRTRPADDPTKPVTKAPVACRVERARPSAG